MSINRFDFLNTSMTFAEDLNDTNLTYELDDNEIIPESYSFSDFQEKINQSEDNSSISINGTYRYDKNIDENNSLNDGVVISKNLTIIGDNCTIDGNNLARCFHIKSNLNIVLENLTIVNGYSDRGNGGGILTDQYV